MKKEDLKNTRQFKNATKNKIYVNNVPLTWCVRFDLSPLDLITYCIIRDATRELDHGAYTGSVKGLCAKTNVSRPTQMESLKRLVEKGFLRREAGRRTEKGWVEYKAYEFNDKESIEDQLESHRIQASLMNTIRR